MTGPAPVSPWTIRPSITRPHVTRPRFRPRGAVDDLAVDDRGPRADAGGAQLGDPLFGGADEPVADQRPDRRQQEQQPRDVGDQAGHEQQHPARGTSMPSVSSACGPRRCATASAIACAARTPSRRASHIPTTAPASKMSSVHPTPIADPSATSATISTTRYRRTNGIPLQRAGPR